MKLVPGSASQLCLFRKVLARARGCLGVLSPESGLIEQQNANNELLCLCCLFVITHVSNPKSEDEDKVLPATWGEKSLLYTATFISFHFTFIQQRKRERKTVVLKGQENIIDHH